MTDLQATLDAIDTLAVQECGHCRQPLDPDGPSPDFCGDWCQAVWLQAKQEIVDLVGYREPSDLPQHAYNLVEMFSPEVMPIRSYAFGGLADLSVTFTFDTSQLQAALDRADAVLAGLRDRMGHFGDAYFRVIDQDVTDAGVRQIRRAEWIRGPSAPWAVIDELHLWQPTGIRNMPGRASGEPAEAGEHAEPFGADFDFEWRPASTLPDTPPPVVLAPLPERDWQALIDRTAGPERRVRAPRLLPGRRR